MHLFLLKIGPSTKANNNNYNIRSPRCRLQHMPMIIRESYGPRLRMSKKRKYVRKESVNNY